MGIKAIHGRYVLCHPKKKHKFFIYDTKLDKGRAFDEEIVVEFTKKTHPKTVKTVVLRGTRQVRSNLKRYKKPFTS